MDVNQLLEKIKHLEHENQRLNHLLAQNGKVEKGEKTSLLLLFFFLVLLTIS